MTAIQLKSQLMELIQKEGNVKLLELVRSLLDHDGKENSLRSLMIERTMRAEQDIAAGRTLSHEEAVKRVKAHIRKKA